MTVDKLSFWPRVQQASQQTDGARDREHDGPGSTPRGRARFRASCHPLPSQRHPDSVVSTPPELHDDAREITADDKEE